LTEAEGLAKIPSVPIILIILFMGGVAACFIFFTHAADKSRIQEEVEKMGATVLDISWRPFGGFPSKENERYYNVTFQEPGRTPRTSICKTSFWTGVFWDSETPGPQFQHKQPYSPGPTHAPAPMSYITASCPNCKKAVQPSWQFCPHCGYCLTQEK